MTELTKTTITLPNIGTITLDAIALTKLQEKMAELEEDSNFLRCLESAGVDNWDGYEQACEMMGED